MRGFALLWVPLLAAAAAIAATESTVSMKDLRHAQRLAQQGGRAFDRGRLDAAEEKYGRALALVPRFPEACIGLGRIAMARENHEQALELYERARDGYAELGGALLEVRVQRFTMAQTEIESLRDSLRKLGSLEAGVPPAYATQIARIENRIAQLEAVEAPDPQRMERPPGEIYFHIGNALFRLGQLEEAIGAWHTCCERSPGFALVHNNLAVAYWKLGRLDEARASLDRAEQLGFAVNPQFKADLQ